MEEMIKMKLKYKFLVVALLISLTFSLSAAGAAEDVPFEKANLKAFCKQVKCKIIVMKI